MHPGEVVVLGVVMLLLLPPWLAVRDIWGRPPDAWSRAGRSRWGWTVVAVLLPVIGPVLYVRLARPDVRTAAGR